MKQGKRQNVAKAKKCKAIKSETSTPRYPLSPAQSIKKFLPVYLYPATYIKVRRLADHYGFSLCYTVGLIVDAAMTGAGLLDDQGEEEV